MTIEDMDGFIDVLHRVVKYAMNDVEYPDPNNKFYFEVFDMNERFCNGEIFDTLGLLGVVFGCITRISKWKMMRI